MQHKQTTMAVISLLSALLFTLVHGNPAIEREFHRVVNSNDCLRECMRPVQESNLELSIFKRSNYTDYLLKLDTICELITNARQCIDTCGIQSNPFALLSVNAICSEKSRQEAKLLEQCLANNGPQVQDQCAETCGDYEQLNDQIHAKSSTIKLEDEEATARLAQETNSACVVMKCSARCIADTFNRQCGHLANGQLAGDLIRQMVERILKMHRVDLEVFGLVQSMMKNTPPECSYLYTPDALFSPLKDATLQRVSVGNNGAEGMVTMPQQNASPLVSLRRADEQQQNSLLAGRLYVRLLRKQIQLLDKQMAILDKKEHKLDKEERDEMPRFLRSPPSRFYAPNEMF